MTSAEYYTRMYYHTRKQTRSTETAPWWVEPLIGSILAVMVWLLFVGC